MIPATPPTFHHFSKGRSVFRRAKNQNPAPPSRGIMARPHFPCGLLRKIPDG